MVSSAYRKLSLISKSVMFCMKLFPFDALFLYKYRPDLIMTKMIFRRLYIIILYIYYYFIIIFMQWSKWHHILFQIVTFIIIIIEYYNFTTNARVTVNFVVFCVCARQNNCLFSWKSGNSRVCLLYELRSAQCLVSVDSISIFSWCHFWQFFKISVFIYI